MRAARGRALSGREDVPAPRLLRPEIIAPLAVFLTTCLVFSGALRNGFVTWDDDTNFLANPHYRGLALANLRWMFLSPTVTTYEPLVWLVFAGTYLVFGENSFAYHFSGVLTHALTATALYGVTVCLLKAAAPDGKNSSETALRWSAALAALLFALHPLRVEAVAWLSGRHHAQGSLFILLSVWAYLKARAAREDASARRRWFAAALLSYALSLLSGPIGVTLPIVLPILDGYLSRAGKAPGGFDWRASLREKFPFFALAAAAGLATLRTRTAAPGGLLPLAQHGLGDRLCEALFGLAFYAWKTLAPFRLSPLYSLPAKIDFLAWPFLLSGLFVAAATAAVFALRRRWPSLPAAWAFYVATLLPVLGFAQYGPQLAADRYSYLPSLGLAVLAAGALARLWPLKGPRAWKAAALAVGALLLGLSSLSRRQVEVWRDSESLWRRVLSMDPRSAIAQNNMGNLLAAQGRKEESVARYHLALAARPGYADAHNNIGAALAAEGKRDEAIREYELALREQPDDADAHYNLGIALAAQGRREEALEQLRTVLRSKPESPEAHYNLGVILAGQGKTDEAIREYGLALQARPRYPEAHNNLGAALAAQGKFDEAIPHFQQALLIEPRYAAAQRNLEAALKLSGQNR